MTTFEYKLLDTDGDDWFDELQNLGRDGWEAITSVPTNKRDLPWLLVKRQAAGSVIPLGSA
jgi:hypothetical protein